MQQQRIPDERRGTGLSEEEIDNTVASFLLDGQSWPWSLDEIARELGDRPDAEDGVPAWRVPVSFIGSEISRSRREVSGEPANCDSTRSDRAKLQVVGRHDALGVYNPYEDAHCPSVADR